MGVLDGRHVLITGGGTGIGAAIAARLGRAGAALSLTGRRMSPLAKTAASLPRAKAIVADVTSEANMGAMVAAAHAAHGPIDILIANAGAAECAPVARLDLAHWQRMLEVNLTGAFLSVKAVLTDLLRADAPLSRIVFIASAAGLKGYPYVAAYCAAKHGVVGLARAAGEQSQSTVSAISSGSMSRPCGLKRVRSARAASRDRPVLSAMFVTALSKSGVSV